MSQSHVALRSYLDGLLLERSVTAHYAQGLRHRVDAFSDYLGRIASLGDLTSDTVNQYVVDLEARSGWGKKTVHDYRSVLVLIWRAAFDRGDLERPPWRLRPVKVPKRVVRAWTIDELRAILRACKWLRGYVPGTLIRKRDWMRAFILVAYSTGLRRCDVMTAKRADVRDGILTVVECKTGKVIARRLSEQAVAALGLVEGADELLLPWPGQIRRFYASFSVLVRRAGVTPGGPHKIRKSAGSYAQKENGNGQQLLGHEDAATFHRHYHDRTISQDVPAPPPPL